MSEKLVKEIVTTTTERYGDGGGIKEKIIETREKVYQSDFSDEEINKAKERPSQKEDKKEKVVEEKKVEIEKKQEETKDSLIQEAAKAIDNNKNDDMNKSQSTTNQQQIINQQGQQYGLQPPPGYIPMGDVPRYNVVNRGVNPPAFPWENK